MLRVYCWSLSGTASVTPSSPAAAAAAATASRSLARLASRSRSASFSALWDAATTSAVLAAAPLRAVAPPPAAAALPAVAAEPAPLAPDSGRAAEERALSAVLPPTAAGASAPTLLVIMPFHAGRCLAASVPPAAAPVGDRHLPPKAPAPRPGVGPSQLWLPPSRAARSSSRAARRLASCARSALACAVETILRMSCVWIQPSFFVCQKVAGLQRRAKFVKGKNCTERRLGHLAETWLPHAITPWTTEKNDAFMADDRKKNMIPSI